MDEEILESSIGGYCVGLDTGDSSQRRSRPQPADQSVHCVGFPLGEDFDPPIGEVAHPTDQSQGTGNLTTALPIADLLHQPGDMGMNGLLSHTTGNLGRSGWTDP